MLALVWIVVEVAQRECELFVRVCGSSSSFILRRRNLFDGCRALCLLVTRVADDDDDTRDTTWIEHNTQLFAQFYFGRCRETARFIHSLIVPDSILC